jgi:uncharacterized protein
VTIAIRIDELIAGPIQRADAFDMGWCDAKITKLYKFETDKVTVNFSATQTAEIIAVEVRLEAGFGFQCSRCVAPSCLELDTRFVHHYVAPGKLDVTASLVQSDEVAADPDISEHDGSEIDLQPLCVEHIILALPNYPLCSEFCKGLCSLCGVNLNAQSCDCKTGVDPWSPWTSLTDFKIEPAA